MLRLNFRALTGAVALCCLAPFAWADTVFNYTAEYGVEPTVGADMANLNGSMGQVGAFSGAIPGAIAGQSQFDPEVVGFADNPNGGRLMWFDRPAGDGQFSLNMDSEVLLSGATVAFQLGTRRTQGNSRLKDYDIVGFDSGGVESFHITVSASNDNGGTHDGSEERLGIITGGGSTTTYDLPTVSGADADNDMNNTGGPAFTTDDLADIALDLQAGGFTIDFARAGLAYSTDLLAYNEAATTLSRIEFQFNGDPSAQQESSGFILDNFVVDGTPVAIPEPSAYLLGLLGIAGVAAVGWWCRRRGVSASRSR